jgi:hypothetical protein
MDLAPLCVPIEIRRADRPSGRCFRLGIAIGIDRLRLRSPLPPELVGPPLRISLQLPAPTPQAEAIEGEWDGELLLHAVSSDLVVDEGTERERAEPRILALRGVSPESLERIENYITLRMLSDE